MKLKSLSKKHFAEKYHDCVLRSNTIEKSFTMISSSRAFWENYYNTVKFSFINLSSLHIFYRGIGLWKLTKELERCALCQELFPISKLTQI